MKIKYLILATFLFTSDSGIRIVTDPYKTGDDLTCQEVGEWADIVTISHEHADHNNVAAVRGQPRVFRETGKAKGILFKGIPAFHDSVQGTWLGKNTIFCFEVDGIKFCHCGDLGQLLDERQIAEIGRPDVLLVPVGGRYDLDADRANQVCQQLEPKVIIPMHFKTPDIHFPFEVESVDDFLRDKKNVTRLDVSEIELRREQLPASPQIIVLKTSK